MLVSWLLFPVLLAALCLGCGLLLEALAGRRIPGALLAPLGFAVLLVIAWLFTSLGETASLATPAVVLAALAGGALGYPWQGRRPDRLALAAALAVFAVYAAPIVLSGDPTFAGYIKLDDTATWMTLADRVMDHGRDLSGLEPSSYQATLAANLPGGYPVGTFLPLGIGTKLTGTDVAWLVQPYMATMAALLSLTLYWLARPLVESRPLRALAGFGASQSALLFAYSLWEGSRRSPWHWRSPCLPRSRRLWPGRSCAGAKCCRPRLPPSPCSPCSAPGASSWRCRSSGSSRCGCGVATAHGPC